MAVEVAPRRFTVAEYTAMATAGVLCEDERVELLDGEILTMNPVGSDHVKSVRRLTRHLYAQLADRFSISVQDPFVLDDTSEPQPDLVVLQRAVEVAAGHAQASDVLLVIEVADTTLRYDTTRKAAAYARSGIPELWVVDLAHRLVWAFRDPGADGYRSLRKLGPGETLEAAQAPFRILVEETFPEQP